MLKKRNLLKSTYLNVDGVKQNPQRAIEIFSEVEEWFVVGEIYRDGIGVKQDGQTAIEFLNKAKAWYPIEEMYRNASGSPK